MGEAVPVDVAADLMDRQFLKQGKDSFTFDFGNIHDALPDFAPTQATPAFEQAAVRLKIRIVIEEIGPLQIRITILERPPVIPPGGFHRRLNV
jgi:hypothetical protein